MKKFLSFAMLLNLVFWTTSGLAAPQDVPDVGAVAGGTIAAEGAAWSGTGIGVLTVDNDAVIGSCHPIDSERQLQ